MTHNIDWTTLVKTSILTGTGSATFFNAGDNILTISLPAGKWEVTSVLRGYTDANSGFFSYTHCGVQTYVNEYSDGTIRPYHVFVDIVEPTSQTTYSMQSSISMNASHGQTMMTAKRIG